MDTDESWAGGTGAAAEGAEGTGAAADAANDVDSAAATDLGTEDAFAATD